MSDPLKLTILCLALSSFALPSTEARAAAWPREVGTGFLSFSIMPPAGDGRDGGYASVFFEYGLFPKLTLGIDAGRSIETSDSSAILFLRRGLANSDSKNQFAVELGLGSAEIGSDTHAVIRPGLSWGRGYQARWGQGWMGIEGSYAFRNDAADLGKLDATFGLNHPSGSLSIVQLQYSKATDGDASLALAPSHVMKVLGNKFIEIGASYKFSDDILALKLAIWTEF